jgi:HEAT repeat protein
MRVAVAVLIAVLSVASASGQGKKLNSRYGIDVDIDTFPQKTAKEALGSVVKAMQQKRIDYLIAQLTDPKFADQRIKEVHGGKFEGLVQETTTKLLDDPETVKQLQRFVKDGDWKVEDETAVATVKDVKDRVFFRKLEDRWFLENRNRDEEKKDEEKKDDK